MRSCGTDEDEDVMFVCERTTAVGVDRSRRKHINHALYAISRLTERLFSVYPCICHRSHFLSTV